MWQIFQNMRNPFLNNDVCLLVDADNLKHDEKSLINIAESKGSLNVIKVFGRTRAITSTKWLSFSSQYNIQFFEANESKANSADFYLYLEAYEKKSNLNSISYKLNPENLSRITSIFSN